MAIELSKKQIVKDLSAVAQRNGMSFIKQWGKSEYGVDVYMLVDRRTSEVVKRDMTVDMALNAKLNGEFAVRPAE